MANKVFGVLSFMQFFIFKIETNYGGFAVVINITATMHAQGVLKY